MDASLSREEHVWVAELIDWDLRRRAIEERLAQVSLIAGGLLIIAAALWTVAHLTDTVVTSVLVPGVLAGLFLVGLHNLARARVHDRHVIAVIARKLLSR